MTNTQTTFGIDGLRQIARTATDLDAGVRFFGDTLGLRLIARFDPPGLAFFDLGNGTRLLLETNAAAGSSILYLQVPDLEAAVGALQDRGVEFVDEPHMIFRDDAGQFGAPGGEEWMTFFRDPDGGLLALAARR